MSSLFLHLIKLIAVFWSKPERVTFFFVEPILEIPPKELALAETVKSM